MRFRDGEIMLETEARIVVRGHYTPDEMQRRTGFQGNVMQTRWRAANPKYTTGKPIETPKGNYVRSRRNSRGSFPVTVLDVVKNARQINLKNGTAGI